MDFGGELSLSHPLIQRLALLGSGWLLLYCLIRPFCSAVSANRVVSLIHAVIAFALSVCAINLRTWKEDIGKPTTPAQADVLTFSLAYFIYDSLCSLAIEWDIFTLFHHMVTIGGLVVGVFRGTSGAELTLCLAMMEASNPFMHARFLMKGTALKDTAAASLNDALFGLTFLAFRVVLSPPVVIATLRCPTTDLIVKVGALGVQLISLLWAYQIIRIARHKLSGGSRRSKVQATAAKAD